MRCERQSGQPAARRHCHSPVNVRGCTFKAEWQCNRHARGRVAVQLTLPLNGERITHHVQGRVAAQSVRSMPSGSEGMGSGYARGRVAVRPGLPNGRERTKSVRSGLSGSEGMGSGYARGRVAVHLTLPLASERTTRHVQGRVAVQSVRSGPSGSAAHTATRR